MVYINLSDKLEGLACYAICDTKKEEDGITHSYKRELVNLSSSDALYDSFSFLSDEKSELIIYESGDQLSFLNSICPVDCKIIDIKSCLCNISTSYSKYSLIDVLKEELLFSELDNKFEISKIECEQDLLQYACLMSLGVYLLNDIVRESVDVESKFLKEIQMDFVKILGESSHKGIVVKKNSLLELLDD